MRNILYKWLRRSERVTKTDMLYLSKGGYWFGQSQAVQLGASFVLALIFARILPKEVYGNYQYILSLTGLMGALMLTGMGVAITRSVARGFEGVVHRAVNLYLRWSVVVSSIALLASLYYFLNGNTVLSLSLVIASIGVPIARSSLLINSFLVGRKNFKFLAQNKIILSLVTTGVLITAGLLFGTSVPLLVLAYFVGHAGGAYILMRYTLKKFPPNNRLDKHESLMNTFGSIVSQLDKVLVFQLLGAAPLAIYAFAVIFPSVIRGALKYISSLASPKLSVSKQSRSFKNVLYKSTIFAVATSVLVIIYILLAKLAFTIFFPAYVEAVPYSQILALALIPRAFHILIVGALKAHRAIKKLYIFRISMPIVEIALFMVLIPLYGLWGVVLAHLLGLSIRAVTSTVLLYLHKEAD